MKNNIFDFPGFFSLQLVLKQLFHILDILLSLLCFYYKFNFKMKIYSFGLFPIFKLLVSAVYKATTCYFLQPSKFSWGLIICFPLSTSCKHHRSDWLSERNRYLKFSWGRMDFDQSFKEQVSIWQGTFRQGVWHDQRYESRGIYSTYGISYCR